MLELYKLKRLLFFVKIVPAFSAPWVIINSRVIIKTHREKYFMSVALCVCNISLSDEEC